jgi:hypothetical protein
MTEDTRRLLKTDCRIMRILARTVYHLVSTLDKQIASDMEAIRKEQVVDTKVLNDFYS